MVSGRSGSGVGCFCGARAHPPAECKSSRPPDSCLATVIVIVIVLLLQEQKNGIELFVSSGGPGPSEPRPAEEVVQALNLRVLHRHLAHLGVTEISTEVRGTCWCCSDVEEDEVVGAERCC